MFWFLCESSVAGGRVQDLNSGSSRRQLVAKASFPKAAGNVVVKNTIFIGKNVVYDGEMKRFQLSSKCTGQKETLDVGAMFILADGATLRNAIIGKDQTQGVKCKGSCRITNVWWEDVCEDALTGDGPGTVVVNGGGARKAADKVVQHNGKGTINITNFYVEDFGKLYRACGNCKSSTYTRYVNLENITAIDGSMLAGINKNYNDRATFRNIKTRNVKIMCGKFQGTNVGWNVNDHPKLLSTGYDNKYCRKLD